MVVKVLTCGVAFLSLILLTIPDQAISQVSFSHFLENEDDGHCIWYGMGALNPDNDDNEDFRLNMAYNGTALPLYNPENQITNLLRSRCPEMVEEIVEEYGELVTCCSPRQISDLTSQLGLMDAFVKRCPACQKNLMNTFCYFTCHPKHSKFLAPKELYIPEDELDPADYRYENITHIKSVDYFMDNETLYRIFDSCKEVFYPEMGVPALNVLCGPWGSQCTPERLFTYFGNNTLTPFAINYYYVNESSPELNDYEDAFGELLDIYPYDRYSWTCNTNESLISCNCADCRDSCPPLPPDPLLISGVTVGKMDLYSFIIIMIFIVEIFLIVSYHICFRRSKKNLSVQSNSRANLTEDKASSKGNPLLRCTHTLSAKWEEFLRKWFTKMATGVARNPIPITVVFLAATVVLIIGMYKLKVTTDPVSLWAAPDSRSLREKNYYDEKFTPFYRTVQVIMNPKMDIQGRNVTLIDTADVTYNYYFGPALDPMIVKEAMDLQLRIQNLTGDVDGVEITMKDVCTKPLYPASKECVIMSVPNYWQNDPVLLQNDIDNGADYDEKLVKCIGNPTNVLEPYCLGTYGGPVLPYVALGGFFTQGEISLSDNPNYYNSTALILTMTLENYLDKDENIPAMAWEKSFLDFIQSYSSDVLNIAYYAERSIEDELIRESVGDLGTIAVSYVLMFVYITLALGNLSVNCSRLLIESKIMVGLGGVIIVLLAVCASLGFYGYIGVEATLFVIEVVPFLVLAVGVDNIFIMVQTWQRMERDKTESIEEHIGRVVGEVGPTILVSTCSEAICFFLGALSKMPAVYSFSLYAGLALLIDFILQMTIFVALLTYDAYRIENDRYDIVCCKKGSKSESDKKDDALCYNFLKEIYAPFLFQEYVKPAVVILFSAMFFTNACFIPKLDVGLDQYLSMPEDSYVIDYFDALNKYLSVGPPVYFVVTDGMDFTTTENQNLFCSSVGCDPNSVLTQIFVASLKPNVTYVGTATNSWLESYLSWITDAGGKTIEEPLTSYSCCRLDEENNFINTSVANAGSAAKHICMNATTIDDVYRRPLPQYFMEYLPEFLLDNPHGVYCPQAGHPSYGEAVEIITNEYGIERVGANYFMGYHTILKTSADFTNAMREAYELTDNLTAFIRENSNTTAEIFPYSIFYVYYEQYLTMWDQVIFSLGISLVAVYLTMLALTGLDIWTSTLVLINIIMIVVNIMGMMYWWNISLNAISLVNLVMAIGISVEFCSHISHAFAFSIIGDRNERALEALATMGSSVFSGITLTKFIGIIVLAFAQSQIFKVFYFRMYLGMVLFGGLHGLIFLPVLFSIAGPSVNTYLLEKSRTTNLNQESPSDTTRI